MMLASSSAAGLRSSSFLGRGCSTRVVAPQPARVHTSGLVIEAAHKKGAGSTKNGRDSESKRRGIKVFGGQPVKAGGIIYRQTGSTVSLLGALGVGAGAGWGVGCVVGQLAGSAVLGGPASRCARRQRVLRGCGCAASGSDSRSGGRSGGRMGVRAPGCGCAAHLVAGWVVHMVQHAFEAARCAAQAAPGTHAAAASGGQHSALAAAGA
jgi:hypothetical protein